jgi:hypothetical protein
MKRLYQTWRFCSLDAFGRTGKAEVTLLGGEDSSKFRLADNTSAFPAS